MNKLHVKQLGQVKDATVGFGDLTVLVGPQATGKSIFLQLLKLLVDTGPVLGEFRRFNIDWGGDVAGFLELYFGEGMAAIRTPQTEITADDDSVDLDTVLRGKKTKAERFFYIPAQRVLSLREGLTRPFTDYRAGDPFVVREFSEKLHRLVQSEFGKAQSLFPKSNRLKKDYRDLIAEAIFGGFGLKTSADRFQKRMVLSSPDGKSGLPYLVWSAGQREFVPLLLGLYWLIPAAKVSRRGNLEWVAIEELEMGLHPNAISVTLLLVMELLSRGYRVCLSTHSPHVLDVVWALRMIREHGGTLRDVLELFHLPSNPGTKMLAERVLKKTAVVYYFQRNGFVQDISRLDPDSASDREAGWGGLSEFSARVNDIVARVVNRQSSPGLQQ